ncbi:cbb3-type cytochrome oxidase assembly protein CcoS [Shinella sp. WSJ-2]|uniref:cbb3-type cytochrome oxidase assembly protein CcoS n=1 Tax=Shinella sp. G-2 TaxID=3133141 RepID=UPI000E3CB25F|nr:cbb3-type cytochrome oxidase assembly protein CcoS [Shinella sp. WSJ-2]RFZ83915.1 cbb3-type cytochrome oxidase assembly protein CcoS [Shinella sp. WSJ-2]
MTALLLLVPLSLIMGAAGVGAFLWSLQTRQYEDLDGASARILLDDEDESRIGH